MKLFSPKYITLQQHLFIFQLFKQKAVSTQWKLSQHQIQTAQALSELLKASNDDSVNVVTHGLKGDYFSMLVVRAMPCPMKRENSPL